MRHYLGIYDPKTGEVQVMEARKLAVRGILKSELAEAEQEEIEEENLSVSVTVFLLSEHSLIYSIATRGPKCSW